MESILRRTEIMSKNLRFVSGYRKVRQSPPLIYGGDFLF
nr:MAG TPA: hypothetical protein [Caudoviricetes sp.]DAM68344.1 MAG TPA: hypothetical protein [Caudoviricetes sp.]